MHSDLMMVPTYSCDILDRRSLYRGIHSGNQDTLFLIAAHRTHCSYMDSFHMGPLKAELRYSVKVHSTTDENNVHFQYSRLNYDVNLILKSKIVTSM